jgi:hypothetical protein
MLKKLIRQNRNPWQLLFAGVGAFIGLFLLILSMQLYFDVDFMMQENKTEQFLTINKQVSLVNTFVGKSVFNQNDKKLIREQSFVIKSAEYTANRFKVSASSKVVNFRTDLFFESVPSDFMDVTDRRFSWKEGQDEIPIVLSRDYLALYNFGFALSQGLPQFTPSTIQQITVDINIRGNNREETLKGRIVGFSDRINSILVPQSLMDYANKQYGEEPETGASRIILQVANPDDKGLARMLADNGWELSSGRLMGGKLGSLLHQLVLVVAAIGGFLVFLSILIFILNFQLIVARSASDIKLLQEIGYKQSQIGVVLRRELLVFLGIVFVAVVLGLVVFRFLWVTWFNGQGFNMPMYYAPQVVVAGFGVMGVVYWVNMVNIRRQIVLP